ncbi:probable maltase-glucoamylase 2 [Littorina saxatilis]|uniref:P-type domain-containing protein n=1 Tax=Littorina saxatilis TaxID=31220 RepID=A0AAN9G9Q9_9CAEN
MATTMMKTLMAFLALFALLAASMTFFFVFNNNDDTTSPPPTATTTQRTTTMRNTQERVDCFPDARSSAVTLTRELCEQRGCEFDKQSMTDNDGSHACFYRHEGGIRYSVSSKQNTEGGFRVHLRASGPSPFGGDFKKPVLDVRMLSNNLIRFTFDDMYANPPRFRVPLETNLPTGGAGDLLYEFKITDESRLAFVITRKATGTVIFDTGPGGLVLSDQFLQLTIRLPSSDLYGLGEHSHPTFRRDFSTPHSWPAFARDQPPGGDNNLYGVHPFYTCVEDSHGNTHGVFLLNSNAQEYALSPGPMLTWRTIGGVLDFYVFLGPSPENVVQQYTQMIGRPVMPPYWSLGFQLCRYGYDNLSNLQRAVTETRNYSIPHDVQYADIDHMDERMDFTINPNNFSGLSEYFDELRGAGMRTIIILDPALISNVSGYEPYLAMKRVSGNIKWPDNFNVPPGSADDDGSMFGFVWPQGKAVFPDFFKYATQQVWKELIVSHRAKLAFDGLWIDMNEPANFGTNEERPWNWPEDDKPYWSLHCGNNTLDDPPYRPLAAYIHDWPDSRKALSDKTVCMNGVQGDRGQYRHYDVHSLYGWSQTAPTQRALRAATGERGMVISRSTYPGSGKHGGHWLGDNNSLWSHLRDSIVGMLNFNLFGIPYIGADICGFFQDTTRELCLRWMQLGAFYPFSRNHNGYGNREQHPGAFDDEFGRMSREIMETRYWLLPYLYTLFHQAHTQGDTVVRPLHHEFSRDTRTYGIDRQFLWGPALLISPIVEEGQTELEYYLPEGRWYDFFTDEVTTGPVEKTVSVNMTSKPDLHLRGGHIIVLQRPANNTHFSRQNPLTVRVMLNATGSEGKAEGSLFWDDGVSIDTYENGDYLLVRYFANNNKLTTTVSHSRIGLHTAADLRYEIVIVHGVTSSTDVTVKNVVGKTVASSSQFDEKQQKLEVAVDLPVLESFTLSWN